jgi:hypothetical protein
VVVGAVLWTQTTDVSSAHGEMAIGEREGMEELAAVMADVMMALDWVGMALELQRLTLELCTRVRMQFKVRVFLQE